MTELTNKSWYKSKSIWAAIAMAGLGTYVIIAQNNPTTGGAMVTAALGLWGVRTGNRAIK